MIKLETGIVLFGLLLATVSAGRIERNTDEAVERGNRYLDNLINKLLDEEGPEIDPYEIPDKAIGFHRKVVFVNVSGEAKLHRGYISGISSLHRSDDCHLTEENGRLNIKAHLAAGVLNLNYDGSALFMNLGPTITVIGMVGYIEVFLEASINAETGKGGILKTFRIIDVRGMEIQISGLGPLDWVMNHLIKAITTIFNELLKNLIEQKVEAHLAEKMVAYQFPLKDKE